MEIIKFEDSDKLKEMGVDKESVPVIDFFDLKNTGKVNIVPFLKGMHPSNLLVAAKFAEGFVKGMYNGKKNKDAVTYMKFLTTYAFFNKENDREALDQLVALTKMGTNELEERISNYSQHDSVRITYNLQKIHVDHETRNEINKAIQAGLSNKNRKSLSSGVEVKDKLYISKPDNDRHLPLYSAIVNTIESEY